MHPANGLTVWCPPTADLLAFYCAKGPKSIPALAQCSGLWIIHNDTFPYVLFRTWLDDLWNFTKIFLLLFTRKYLHSRCSTRNTHETSTEKYSISSSWGQPVQRKSSWHERELQWDSMVRNGTLFSSGWERISICHVDVGAHKFVFFFFF